MGVDYCVLMFDINAVASDKCIYTHECGYQIRDQKIMVEAILIDGV